MPVTNKVKVLDGGFGHLLRRKGIEIKGEIGSIERFLGVALANLEQPALVAEAHKEYLKAGAQVVTTNSYACVPSIVGSTEKVLETIRAAGTLARAAADEHGALVAGCLPPLKNSYRPDLVGTDEELAKEYALIAETIAPYADVMLCETMSSAREAVAAVYAASKHGKPVWVSWALSEDMSGELLSGETVEQAVEALQLKEGSVVEACLFNCSLPECISVALPKLQAAIPDGILTGAYANGFCTVKSPGGGNSEYREDLSPHQYGEVCRNWVQNGCSIVGGCCGVFPEHINAVALAVSPELPGQNKTVDVAMPEELNICLGA